MWLVCTGVLCLKKLPLSVALPPLLLHLPRHFVVALVRAVHASNHPNDYPDIASGLDSLILGG